MTYSWSKTVFPIAAIFSFRMLGLFLLIPVFTIYAAHLQGATPALIGLALGGYGLTQGLLQIPFGMLSDKVGRKPIITLGLLLFACGSLIGALTDSIYGMILARTLQGTGAIGSVLIALLADLTPDRHRTKAMAVIGMTIGTSFSLAMIISPALSHRFGLAGIFYLTTALAILGILLLQLVIPNPLKERFHPDSEANPHLFKSVINNQHLQRLNLGIFCQHFILTATFFAIPMILSQQVNNGHLTQQWHFYLPLMVSSFIFMIPFIILAEKKKRMKSVFLASVLVTTVAQGLLAFIHLYWVSLCLLMFVYFVAFNILEASLPSLISKQANPNNKGTAMGIYSTGQFLGIFAGGSLAGIIYQWNSSYGIFIVNAIIGTIWFVVACFMKPNVYLSSLILNYTSSSKDTAVIQALLKIPGVKEVALVKEENTMFLRVDEEHYQAGSAEQTLIETSAR
ncbi:MFS transporter [Legionella maioricensis]|uniref:MFS transporter n=1 Tax=Legionella maioricensis TaxID=2896528 RepID=A0A9X2CZ59_9GAMM|nr:MFS transporter [Legionella maioricensis]MCL9683208.1 MFS transporter [Legionella maioricensis]MCL9686094.1 MFS transporter [Legionella maioricensis]